ncbi:MAG: hypothetical protein U1E14_06675 [Geminicoccaceae bacterium]
MPPIPHSDDPSLSLAGRQRGTNDLLAQTGDYLLGDRWTITDHARGGNDVLTGTTVYGDGYTMDGWARGGNDLLIAAGEGATLVGDARDLGGSARGGNDRLVDALPPAPTSGAAARLYGDAVNLDGQARGGNDILFGQNLYGDASGLGGESRGGNDVLVARDGAACILRGDAFSLGTDTIGGNDRLVSGTGNDELYGDSIKGSSNATVGRDTFVFRPDSGTDLILDFQQGFDRIDVRALGYDSFAGIEPDIEVVRSTSIIHFSADDQVSVVGFAALTAADFVFA